MKIKIPPYPNLQITEEAFERDVVNNAILSENSKDLTKNNLFTIIEFENGEKRVLRSRPIEHNGNKYITAFPNPIHLFLSLAVEHYEHSEKIKRNNFPECGKQYGDDIFLLDIEKDGTHSCYNKYIMYRMSSIIMLVSALEAFLNYILPNDFIYTTNRKGSEIKFSKSEIESAKLSFNEKLLKVIPQYLNQPNFWNSYTEQQKILTSLYENRKNIVHLKTNAKDDFERYFEQIDNVLDLDLLVAINTSTFFMNLISPEFVQYSSNEN